MAKETLLARSILFYMLNVVLKCKKQTRKYNYTLSVKQITKREENQAWNYQDVKRTLQEIIER